jgi:hypothetical protein
LTFTLCAVVRLPEESTTLNADAFAFALPPPEVLDVPLPDVSERSKR